MRFISCQLMNDYSLATVNLLALTSGNDATNGCSNYISQYEQKPAMPSFHLTQCGKSSFQSGLVDAGKAEQHCENDGQNERNHIAER